MCTLLYTGQVTSYKVPETRPCKTGHPISVSGPAPTLNSFAVSRGPSPLTLGGAETVPLAVAFQVIGVLRAVALLKSTLSIHLFLHFLLSY